MTARITIVQVFRVEREITIDVEACSIQDAIDRQEESEAPAYDDPRWTETRSFENEVVRAA